MPSPCKDEENLSVQDVEKEEEMVTDDDVDGDTSNTQRVIPSVIETLESTSIEPLLPQATEPEQDCEDFSFSFGKDCLETVKRPVACYVCKQDGHTAKVSLHTVAT